MSKRQFDILAVIEAVIVTALTLYCELTHVVIWGAVIGIGCFIVGCIVIDIAVWISMVKK